MMYLLNVIELTPGGSSTVHIYTQKIHRTTQLIWEECGTCPVFLDRFSLKSSVPNFKGIRPMGDKGTDVRVDMTTLTSATVRSHNQSNKLTDTVVVRVMKPCTLMVVPIIRRNVLPPGSGVIPEDR